MVRVLISTGGSVGHLAPAVAVWRALAAREPRSAVHVLTSDRPEDGAYLTSEGLPWTALPLPRRGLALPRNILRGYGCARTLIEHCRPDVFFSKGGAVSVGPAWAAHRLGIPVILHESDVVSGHANRLVARFADTICLGFPSNRPPYSKELVTGNPVRPKITQGSREEGLRLAGFAGSKAILLVMGGSQGAQAINDAIADLLPRLLAFCDVVHITGKGKDTAQAQPGYFPLPFAGGELPHLYAIASAAVGRAGAGSIAELAANAIPSILVPIRGLAQDHQYKNAVQAQKIAGCPAIAQEALREELPALLAGWFSSPEILAMQSEKMRLLCVPDAAERIAGILLDAARGSR